MKQEWQQISKLSDGTSVIVERVRIPDKGIAVEGEFELPALARLSSEDQIFVMAFIHAHGSIKRMEEMFGVSYPTIKNRLNRLASLLELAEFKPKPLKSEILDQLERGEIDVKQALEKMQ